MADNETKGKSGDQEGTSVAFWSEDIMLDPGPIRFPIRVVLVDNQFQTKFDRLVRLPKGSTTYIYRVLDHGIPWQHLEAGLPLEQVKKKILTLCQGKELVVYDVFRFVELFGFTLKELTELKIYDLRGNSKSLGPDGQPLEYWDLVKKNLNHTYSGKPGNYDTLELADFLMSIYLKYKEEATEGSTLPPQAVESKVEVEV